MKKAVLAADDPRATETLRTLCLPFFSCEPDILLCREDAETYRKWDECSLFILNTPLWGEDGLSLAERLADRGDFGILLLARREEEDAVGLRCRERGIAFLAKPVTRQSFSLAVGTIESMLNRASCRANRWQDENRRLKTKLDGMKLIDRAKCLLIQNLGMSEAAAHRYMEKQAMDLRLSRVEVAESILKTYDYFGK